MTSNFRKPSKVSKELGARTHSHPFQGQMNWIALLSPRKNVRRNDGKLTSHDVTGGILFKATRPRLTPLRFKANFHLTPQKILEGSRRKCDQQMAKMKGENAGEPVKLGDFRFVLSVRGNCVKFSQLFLPIVLSAEPQVCCAPGVAVTTTLAISEILAIVDTPSNDRLTQNKKSLKLLKETKEELASQSRKKRNECGYNREHILGDISLLQSVRAM